MKTQGHTAEWAGRQWPRVDEKEPDQDLNRGACQAPVQLSVAAIKHRKESDRKEKEQRGGSVYECLWCRREVPAPAPTLKNWTRKLFHAEKNTIHTQRKKL